MLCLFLAVFLEELSQLGAVYSLKKSNIRYFFLLHVPHAMLCVPSRHVMRAIPTRYEPVLVLQCIHQRYTG